VSNLTTVVATVIAMIVLDGRYAALVNRDADLVEAAR
jgi:hypothetical protein